MTRFFTFAFCLLLAIATSADEVKSPHLTSGTGFIVSNQGHIVTNAHVVKDCQQVTVRGAVPQMAATILAKDTAHDLALLKIGEGVRKTAVIRGTGGLPQAGSSALVMGYPMEHGISGEYILRETKIIDTKGPDGDPQWLQLTNSVELGNSGGPLLDSSGEVIGVIIGKAQLLKMNETTAQEETVRQFDLAISLPVLKHFLAANKVFYRTSNADHYLPWKRIEAQARQYIVNIHCTVQPVVSAQ